MCIWESHIAWGGPKGTRMYMGVPYPLGEPQGHPYVHGNPIYIWGPLGASRCVWGSPIHRGPHVNMGSSHMGLGVPHGNPACTWDPHMGMAVS